MFHPLGVGVVKGQPIRGDKGGAKYKAPPTLGMGVVRPQPIRGNTDGVGPKQGSSYLGGVAKRQPIRWDKERVGPKTKLLPLRGGIIHWLHPFGGGVYSLAPPLLHQPKLLGPAQSGGGFTFSSTPFFDHTQLGHAPQRLLNSSPYPTPVKTPPLFKPRPF